MRNGSKVNIASCNTEEERIIRDGKFICIFLSAKEFADCNRLRALKEEPYSQKEAEAAIGLGTDNGVRSSAESQMDVETSDAQV